MATITTHARIKTLPQFPMQFDVNSNQWRVAKIDPDANEFAPWCETGDEYGIMFFSTPGVDGPEDGDASSGAGDYDLVDVRKFKGNVDPESRMQPSLRMGEGGKASPGYVAVASTATITVFAELYG